MNLFRRGPWSWKLRLLFDVAGRAGSSGYFGILPNVAADGVHRILMAHNMVVRFMLPELARLLAATVDLIRGK